MALQWTVLDTDAPDAWLETLGRTEVADSYFLPAYHRAYESEGGGRALAFVAEERGRVFFYPFLLKAIPIEDGQQEAWCDIETVYGYSGPIANCEEPDFLAAAWAAFGDWCAAQRVVAEFIRFNPFLENQRFADSRCEVSDDRPTVVLPIGDSEAALWAACDADLPRKVRKAERAGLRCEEVAPEEGLADFQRLYRATMERAGARAFYYFSPAYFESLLALGDGLRMHRVKHEQRTLAVAMTLAHGDRLHGHLMGSDPEARATRPVNFLYFSIARWGLEHGFRWLHMGGGRTPSPDDSLLLFKTSISPHTRRFHVGRHVREPEVYARLCRRWAERHPEECVTGYFRPYHLLEANRGEVLA